MKYTAHILSHTHWDREWYLNSSYTNEWLIPFFDNLFSMLEKEENYKFILDGQTAMIEDYFEELSKNGFSVSKARRTIRSHVERGALFIGPYYLQPDWQLVSEESLVRNLMTGHRLAQSFGGSMKSGWLMDNFGQISQTAQIHKLAGLESVYLWRGVAMKADRITSEFLWESPDGTRLPSIYLINSYRNVMRLAEYKTIMKQRMDTEVKKLKPFARTSHLLMMNGYDQEMIPDDIQPFIRDGSLNGVDYRSIQNDPDSYAQAVFDEAGELPVLKGALYSGRYISVFPGVMSSRMYLKLQNDATQKLLEKQTEPISLMSAVLGGDYGYSLIDQAWKLLMKNHPHDSICGVSIDDVHKDMEVRTRQTCQLASALLERQLAFLAAEADTSTAQGGEALVVFNTMLRSRNAVVQWRGESRLVQDIPALGYKVSLAPDLPSIPLKVDGPTVDNGLIIFALNNDGSFNLQFIETGREYRNLGILEESGDCGDEYDYSYPDRDERFTSQGGRVEFNLIRNTPWEVCYRVFFTMNLPVSATKDSKGRSRKRADMPVTIYYTIEAGSPLVKCRVSLRNTVKDHRVRLLIPTGFREKTAYAASPFDITERPTSAEDYSEEKIPPHVRKMIVGAHELTPSTYFHTREFLDLNNGNEGLSLFNKGLPEYQILDGGVIALTLFRSVGWVSRKINTRTGDAGPEIYTPDAQCLREMNFEYALCPHTGNAFSGTAALAEEFNSDVIVVSTDVHRGKLGARRSWLRLEDSTGNVKITAVKQSEDGRGAVIRGVNLSLEETVASIISEFPLLRASRTDLLEREIAPLPLEENRIDLPIGPKKIFTLKLEFTPEKIAPHQYRDIVVESVNFKEDFGDYPYVDSVTETDIVSEEKRAKTLEAKMDDPMWKRTALEAQLSIILARHRKDEEDIRKLGYQLNEARVQRRILDYLKTIG